MNAAEQAKNFEVASQIATVINLLKSQFPDARVDMKPWMNDPDTQEWVDPDSIDLGFHFPGFSRSLQSRSVLIQIRFHHDRLDNAHRAIGIEVTGYSHKGQQWRFSTVENWRFEGETQPNPDMENKLKHFCRQTLALFNGEGERRTA